MRIREIGRGAALLLLECAGLFAAAAALSMSQWLHPAVSGVCLWGIYPLAGAFAAFGVTTRGVNNYLAWIPAPAMLTLGHYLAWGYLPAAGQMLLSALIGIVGAAAGETKMRFDGRKRR